MPFASPRSAAAPSRLDRPHWWSPGSSEVRRRKDVRASDKVVLDALIDLGKGSLTVQATLDQIADATGLAKATAYRAILRLIALRLIRWDKIGHNFMLRFTLRGIHAGATLPRLADVDEAEPVDAPATEPAFQNEPETVFHSESETTFQNETPNTRGEEFEENNNGGPLSLSVFSPPEEPDPRLAKVIADVLEYIPEATPGMVNLAICDFTVEFVERAVMAFEMTKVRSDPWACFLGILRNFKRQGGPPRIIPVAPSVPEAAAKSGIAETADPRLSADEIAEHVRNQDEPGRIGNLARLALKRGREEGQIPEDTAPVIPQPEKKPAGESVAKRPPPPAGAFGPASTIVHYGTRGTEKTRQQRAREDSNLQPSDSKSEGRTHVDPVAGDGHVPHEPGETRGISGKPSDCKAEGLRRSTVPVVGFPPLILPRE
jgi:hypothetical protein